VASESATVPADDDVAHPRAGTPKRADARRNIEAILDAATSCLAADPDCSVGEVAAAAGVGRVTLYGHFKSRAALVDAVVTRAMADTDAALEVVDLIGDPREALARLIEATWQLTDRFGALVVAAEQVLSPERMQQVHAGRMQQRVDGLIARGQAEGVFRNDLPKDWLVATLHALVHAAAQATATGQLTTQQAPHFINAIAQAALTTPGLEAKVGPGKRAAVR
jgi:TetR/AcrR family transcriptional regulator, mexCD-oprJ operon repressor